MAHYRPEDTSKLKRMEQIVGDHTHRKLQLLALGHGWKIGDVMWQLMQLADLRVSVARESGEVPLDLGGDRLEQFILLLLHDMGLLLDDEFAAAIINCDRMEFHPSKHRQERLNALADVVTERIKVLKPDWERRQASAREQWERWQHEHAEQLEQQAQLEPA